MVATREGKVRALTAATLLAVAGCSAFHGPPLVWTGEIRTISTNPPSGANLRITQTTRSTLSVEGILIRIGSQERLIGDLHYDGSLIHLSLVGSTTTIDCDVGQRVGTDLIGTCQDQAATSYAVTLHTS